MQPIREQESHTTQLITSRQKMRLPLLGMGVVVGAVSGAVVCLFRFAVEKALELVNLVYQQIDTGNLLVLLPWLVALAALALAVTWLVRWEPLSKGSGIPQIEGELRDQVDMVWWRVLLAKFVGGILCMLGGFALGREGPSIQLGAAAAKGLQKLLRRPEVEEKFLITGGASAGLAAAFNAPLSGVMFALEEIHGHFSPEVLLTAMACAVSADVVSKLAFGSGAVLGFSALPVLPVSLLPVLLVLGVLLGLGGVLFNAGILGSQRAFRRIPAKYRMFVAFAVSAVVGCLLPAALGGGHSVIVSLSQGSLLFMPLLLLLLVRFLFTMVCFGSGAPGGIFLPLLSVGALLGALFGMAAVGLGIVVPSAVVTFSALAMAGYFAAVVRAPVTGILLITEMTGSFSHLLSLAAVVLTAYLVAEWLGSKPIYESLLENLLQQPHEISAKSGRKVLVEEVVHVHSQLDNRRICDVAWPQRTLVVGVCRGSVEVIPDGNTVLQSGDRLILLVDASAAGAARKSLHRLATKPS